MEFQGENERISSFQVDSLIWSQPQIQQSNNLFRIGAVGKAIRNSSVLDHIKPDYGSLGQFMKGVGISKDILLHNRKKKLDQQEDLQQKKIRLILKQKNLQNIIRQDNYTPLEKATASKMIVENLFQKNFGIPLLNFCSQNNRQDNSKVNYSSVKSLTEMMENIIKKPKQQSCSENELRQALPVLIKGQHFRSSKEIQIFGLRDRIRKINLLKDKYPSLRKYELKQVEESQLDWKRQIIHNEQFSICSSTITFPMILQLVKNIKFQSIRTLKISNVAISDQLLCFILDLFSKTTCLRQVIINNIKLTNTGRVSLKIKQFIEETSVTKISLTKLSLRSKDFCMICLGIGAKDTLEFVDLRDNEIGEIAIKCLDVLIKFHKQTAFNLSSNPIQREIIGKNAYKRCFSPIQQ